MYAMSERQRENERELIETKNINSAAMNIGLHVSLSILVSSVCMPSSGIAGSYGSSICNF